VISHVYGVINLIGNLLCAPIILATSACSKFGGEPHQDTIKPASLCIVNSHEKAATAEVCSSGQKVVFLPNRWGNEQLPIMFAALNCDLRYSVLSNNGGVTCIYLPTVMSDPPSKPK